MSFKVDHRSGMQVHSNSHFEKSMKRSIRAMYGWPEFELTIHIGKDEAELLANFAGFDSAEDRIDEEKLEYALKNFINTTLKQCAELRNERQHEEVE